MRRGFRSPKEVILDNTRSAVDGLRKFQRSIGNVGEENRRILAGPANAMQKQDAREYLDKLNVFFKTIVSKESEKCFSYANSKANGTTFSRTEQKISEDRFKKLVLAVYLKNFLNSAHERALEKDVAGDFASFKVALRGALDLLLNKDYFYKYVSIEEIATKSIYLWVSLETCADALGMESTDINGAINQSTDAAIDFISKNNEPKV